VDVINVVNQKNEIAQVSAFVRFEYWVDGEVDHFAVNMPLSGAEDRRMLVTQLQTGSAVAHIPPESIPEYGGDLVAAGIAALTARLKDVPPGRYWSIVNQRLFRFNSVNRVP
jgi:hypothetical protein